MNPVQSGGASTTMADGIKAYQVDSMMLEAYRQATQLEGPKLLSSALETYNRSLAKTEDAAFRFRRLRCFMGLGWSMDFDREVENLTRDFGKAAAAYASLVALEFSDTDRALACLQRLKGSG